MGEQQRYSAVIMRGGSSKAVFLKEEELPVGAQRDRLLLALFGSPDKRQIDGLGGADYLTSKCAIMGPPSRDDADIDYTFAQISITNPIVMYDANCGNISAAAALYAVEEGYLPLTEPKTTVRVNNTNTGKVLRISVPVRDGMATVEGDYAIDGVPGTGAEIEIDLSETAGSCTGALLPTGSTQDTLPLGDGTSAAVSIVDIGTPCVFVRAADLGLAGTELPGSFSKALLDRLEAIRVASSQLCGLESHILPLPVIIAPPQSFETLVEGRRVEAADADLVARLFCEKMAHRVYSVTGSACLAAAAQIPGTIPHEAARRGAEGVLRIGHPSGTLRVSAQVHRSGEDWEVDQVLVSRTARRLLEGAALVRHARLA